MIIDFSPDSCPWAAGECGTGSLFPRRLAPWCRCPPLLSHCRSIRLPDRTMLGLTVTLAAMAEAILSGDAKITNCGSFNCPPFYPDFCNHIAAETKEGERLVVWLPGVSTCLTVQISDILRTDNVGTMAILAGASR